jgi:peptide chain release factor 3
LLPDRHRHLVGCAGRRTHLYPPIAALEPCVTKLLEEAARRRTFAIISHPDAGKTTLTEKFLLYAGAIATAGGTNNRKADRGARSDWLELEQKRGISVSSAVMRFEHRGCVFNLLDTPGHRDFSEDTYRVLSGVDAAVMVLDAARGVEPQTLKLFEVCRRRGTPLITFVNKMDRPTPETLDILDDIEKQIGLRCTPVTWPVTHNGRFLGVVDRREGVAHRFEATKRATKSTDTTVGIDDLADDAPELAEELELLDGLGLDHDQETFLAGETTPVFFGSALSNFGVKLLLDAIVDIAPAPSPRIDIEGEPRALDAGTSAQVFKVQANMDPNHRDRIAFIRMASGHFERGMNLTCHRTGRTIAAKYVSEVFGRERGTIDEAWPGDVIGLVNASGLAIGDTLYLDGEPVRYPQLPTFTPEHFRIAEPADRSKVKQFRSGMQQLDQEGVWQVLRHPDLGDQRPIVAAVGVLQFEVAEWRMEHEFNAPVRLEAAGFNVARRTDDASRAALSAMRGVDVYERADGQPIALFPDEYRLIRIGREHPELTLDVIMGG